MFPKARKKDLIIEPLDDETLIYDLRSDKAHCLNKTATLVWRACDGKTDIAKMAKKLESQTRLPVAQDVVELALQRLVRLQLIEKGFTPTKDAHRKTRREVIKTLGKAAGLALPLITSINAPAAVNTASCVASTICTVGGRVGACCCPAKGTTSGKVCISSVVKGKTIYSCGTKTC